MNILITGSDGFVGKNLAENLKAIKKGYNRQYPDLIIDEIYEYDVHTNVDKLDEYCRDVDFVFNFAGTNRTKTFDQFWDGNYGFVSILFDTLKKNNNRCPVVIASSIQATLIGRYNNEYGKSKKAGEELAFKYAEETGANVMVYRFPNLFGKWCKPNYNSVIATFCHNIANDLPITIDDPSTELELLYIDDLINEMCSALLGKIHRCDYRELTPIFSSIGKYCAVPIIHKATLGEIVSLLDSFKNQAKTLVVVDMPKDSLAKKLYSTYVSYIPPEKAIYDLKMNIDSRGSFTEVLKSVGCGQFSINITKPRVTKGQHWHNTKWELFIVVSGKAMIQQRKIGEESVNTFFVSGDKIQAIQIIPGYTHDITNISDRENLITLMWSNEQFDSLHPDTFFEPI